jgi:hypothetical protein
MKYYLPTSSLNFNSIFASESISPHNFYTLRKFGYKRNDKIGLQFDDDYLILYNLPFRFIIDNDELQRYPLLIEIDESVVNDNLIEIQPYQLIPNIPQIKLFSYPKSIYLDLNNFRFIFPSDAIIKIVLAKSLPSIETKTVPKYKQSIITYTDLQQDVFILKREDISMLNRNKKNEQVISYIIQDELFDSFKGMIYSAVIGKYFYRTLAQINLEEKIKSFLNIFGGLKSDLEHIDLELKNKKNQKEDKSKPSNRVVSNKIHKLNTTLEDIENLLIKSFLIDKTKLLEEYLITKKLTSKIEVFISDIIKLGEDYYQNLLYDSQKQMLNKKYKYAEIISSVNKYHKDHAKISNEVKSNLDTTIKDIFYGIESSFEYTNQLQDNRNNFESFVITLSQRDYHSFKVLISELSESEIQILNIIFDALIEKRKKGSFEESSGNLKDILVNVGLKISDNFGQNSKERKYLLDLYSFVFQNEKAIELISSDSYVLMNFAAFIIKPESLEKLENYLITNKVDFPLLAFSMWGSFHGFSALSKPFTNKIFSCQDQDVFNVIDLYLSKLNKKLSIDLVLEK